MFEISEIFEMYEILKISETLNISKTLKIYGKLEILKHLRYLRYLKYLKHLRYVRHLKHLRHLRYITCLRYLRYMWYLRCLRYVRYFRYSWVSLWCLMGLLWDIWETREIWEAKCDWVSEWVPRPSLEMHTHLKSRRFGRSLNFDHFSFFWIISSPLLGIRRLLLSLWANGGLYDCLRAPLFSSITSVI